MHRKPERSDLNLSFLGTLRSANHRNLLSTIRLLQTRQLQSRPYLEGIVSWSFNDNIFFSFRCEIRSLVNFSINVVQFSTMSIFSKGFRRINSMWWSWKTLTCADPVCYGILSSRNLICFSVFPSGQAQVSHHFISLFPILSDVRGIRHSHLAQLQSQYVFLMYFEQDQLCHKNFQTIWNVCLVHFFILDDSYWLFRFWPNPHQVRMSLVSTSIRCGAALRISTRNGCWMHSSTPADGWLDNIIEASKTMNISDRRALLREIRSLLPFTRRDLITFCLHSTQFWTPYRLCCPYTQSSSEYRRDWGEEAFSCEQGQLIYDEFSWFKIRTSQEWDEVLSRRSKTILLSFGSVAKSIYIPGDIKDSILKVFNIVLSLT